MQKIGGLLLCLLLVFVSSKAQTGFKLGAFAMPQAVWLLNDDDQSQSADIYDQKWLSGMAGGISLGYTHPTKIGLQVNIIYSLQGNRFGRLNQADVEVLETTRLEYVKIPVMLGYTYETVKANFSAFVGAQANILTKAYMYDNNQEYETPLSELVMDLPTPFQSFEVVDFNYVADVGMDVKLSYDLMFNLRIRGEYSIGDVENKEAFVRFNDGGEVRTLPYWEYIRAGSPRANTKNLTLGLIFGITYLLDQE